MVGFQCYSPKVIARIWRLKPDLIIIATCTIKNRMSKTAATKCTVRADWKPPNMPDRNGYAAVIAGDIARPVTTVRDRKSVV